MDVKIQAVTSTLRKRCIIIDNYKFSKIAVCCHVWVTKSHVIHAATQQKFRVGAVGFISDEEFIAIFRNIDFYMKSIWKKIWKLVNGSVRFSVSLVCLPLIKWKIHSCNERKLAKGACSHNLYGLILQMERYSISMGQNKFINFTTVILIVLIQIFSQ